MKDRIALSIESTLVSKVDSQALEEHRTRSNMIECIIASYYIRKEKKRIEDENTEREKAGL